MREIKFKGYSKSFKQMFTNEMLEMAAAEMVDMCNEKLKILVPESTEIQMGLFIPTYDKDLILMQYTGLKDKNGKEIYEGDILSYKHIKYTDCSKEEIEDIEKEVLIGLITYRPLASIIKPYSENVMCLGYDNINKECLVIDLESEELEVVGNIYENPELLK